MLFKPYIEREMGDSNNSLRVILSFVDVWDDMSSWQGQCHEVCLNETNIYG